MSTKLPKKWRMQRYGCSIRLVSISDGNSTNVSNNFGFHTATDWDKMFWNFTMQSRSIQICQYRTKPNYKTISHGICKFLNILLIFRWSKHRIHILRCCVKFMFELSGWNQNYQYCSYACVCVNELCLLWDAHKLRPRIVCALFIWICNWISVSSSPSLQYM